MRSLKRSLKFMSAPRGDDVMSDVQKYANTHTHTHTHKQIKADRQQLGTHTGRPISQLRTTYEQQKGARHVCPSLPPLHSPLSLMPFPLPRLPVREDQGLKCVWRSHQPNYQGGRKHNTPATAAPALQMSSTATHCRPLRSKCVCVCVRLCVCLRVWSCFLPTESVCLCMYACCMTV